MSNLTLTAWGSTLVDRICIHQILTTKVDPRTVRVKIFTLTYLSQG